MVIEVDNVDDAIKFADLGADILQLEKFSLNDLHKIVLEIRRLFPHIGLIATGGITLENITEFANTGIDIIVTSSPYSAQPADIKVKIAPLAIN